MTQPVYEIYTRFKFLNMDIDKYFRGADHADCVSKIESAFAESLAESWEILSEGPING